MTALWLALVSVAWGGGWTKEVGQAYVKGGADVYRALRFVAPGEVEESAGAYLGQQYGIYAEAGVLPMHPVQLSVQAPFVVGTHRTEIVDAFGPLPIRATTARAGDLRVAVQTALHRTIPLAGAVEVKVPMYANGSVGAAIPTFQPLFPKPGDGQIDVTGWLYAGAAPWPKTFVEGGLGYMWRSEAFVGWEPRGVSYADSVRFVGKIGRSFGPVLPILGVEGQLAFTDPALDPYTRRFVAISANALVDVAEGVAIEPRVAVEAFARNASQGIGGGLGLSWRR